LLVESLAFPRGKRDYGWGGIGTTSYRWDRVVPVWPPFLNALPQILRPLTGAETTKKQSTPEGALLSGSSMLKQAAPMAQGATSPGVLAPSARASQPKLYVVSGRFGHWAVESMERNCGRPPGCRRERIIYNFPPRVNPQVNRTRQIAERLTPFEGSRIAVTCMGGLFRPRL
jgi:hypothetical protein